VTIIHKIFEQRDDFVRKILRNGDLDVGWIAYVEYLGDGVC